MKTILRSGLIAALSCLAGTARAADAAALWDKHCASCHAKDGGGNTRMGKKVGVKDYRDPKVQEGLKDDKAFKAIKEGLTEKGEEKMKSLGDKLMDEEIKELIKFLRSLRKAP
ncbi:MAG: cytochrome c [Verrucomicrobia bacterium]|nr:cytochrome c [Verrucomicrobiota bacterium]